MLLSTPISLAVSFGPDLFHFAFISFTDYLLRSKTTPKKKNGTRSILNLCWENLQRIQIRNWNNFCCIVQNVFRYHHCNDLWVCFAIWLSWNLYNKNSWKEDTLSIFFCFNRPRMWQCVSPFFVWTFKWTEQICGTTNRPMKMKP